MKVHELAKDLKISTGALKKHLSDLGIKVKSHMSNVSEEDENKIRAKFNEQVAAIKKAESDKRRFQQERKRQQQEDQLRREIALKQQIAEAVKQELTPEPVAPKKEEATAAVKPPKETQPAAEAPKQEQPKPAEKPRRPKPQPVQRREVLEASQNKPVLTFTSTEKLKERRTSGNTAPVEQQRPRRQHSDSNRPQGGSGRPPRSGDSRPPRSGDSRPPRSGSGTGYTPRPATGAPAPVKPSAELSDADKRKFGKTKKELDEARSKHIKAKQAATTKRKKTKGKVPEIDEATALRNIKRTIASPKKRKRYKKEDKVRTDAPTEVVIREFTSVSELAKLMDISPTEIISKFFSMGQMVTINQRLDRESLEMICAELEFEVKFEEEYGTQIIEEQKLQFAEEAEMASRPPVVTIMGHVDHGKTSILDYIRHTSIVAGEAGGITQHIGAYQITHNDRKITFLDTPGHEAFTAMRSRGANVTDIAVIVVAANDGVMPQTVEAIDHARAAGVTMIIAINKVDLPEANIDRTISNLAEKNVYLENYGGDVSWVATSAKTGEGIEELVDYILLTADMQELTAGVGVPGSGVVIETEKNQRTGVIVTVLLQEGELEVGDSIVCGATYGRVRRMLNERNKPIKKIGPSDVAVLYGLNDVPKAGDMLNKVGDDRTARQISEERRMARSERENFQQRTSLANIYDRIKEHQMNEVKLIIKADTDGSVEALADSFQKLGNNEVQVNIIHKSVGGIIEADVSLAAASDAVIIGFHVRANNQAKKQAEDEGVDIKMYQIIYDAIADVKSALEGLLAPEIKEEFLGSALVKQVFKISKVGAIAGCAVEKGTIRAEAKIRIFRNNIKIHEGEIETLKHYQNEVKEVKSGSECGLSIKDFNDIKEGDVLEAYRTYESKREI